MWTIIKFDKKRLDFLKKDLEKKLGKDFIIYKPKLLIQKYKKNKTISQEINLLGDYLFCFHDNFKNSETVNRLKFSKGLKYFLNGFIKSQKEIKKFIQKCKGSENNKGYLSSDFFEINLNKEYKFHNGPFIGMIFKILKLQKNKINIILGNKKTILSKNQFLYSPN